MALSHAILAVLANRSCSGYDLAKQFDGSVGFFWHATHQQIYRELTKLETGGLVDLTVINQDGKPDRKCYTINDLGQAHLREWILLPTALEPVKEELLVKLFVGHLVPLAELVAMLQQQRSLHAENLATYESIEQQFFTPPEGLSMDLRCQYLTLRAGIYNEMGWLNWLDEAIGSMSSLPKLRY
jgi:DNA-binding PadR family transcriptional regulator